LSFTPTVARRFGGHPHSCFEGQDKFALNPFVGIISCFLEINHKYKSIFLLVLLKKLVNPSQEIVVIT
jgi:hypothetical protein